MVRHYRSHGLLGTPSTHWHLQQPCQRVEAVEVGASGSGYPRVDALARVEEEHEAGVVGVVEEEEQH